jgi:putative membrane protein
VSPEEADVSRRTLLAAERTWLAWWRTAIAAAAAAVAVGGVIPRLVEGSHWPDVLLGAGYAAVALAMFLAAGRRQRQVEAELARGGYASLDPRWVGALTIAGAALALGTFVAVIAEL